MLGAGRLEPKSCSMVIFGGSGDLTGRKIAPALYNLMRGGLLPDRTVVIGFGRSEFTDETFRKRLRESADAFSRTAPVENDVWVDHLNFERIEGVGRAGTGQDHSRQ